MSVVLGPIETLSPIVFPDLRDSRWLQVDLNALALRDVPKLKRISPYCDPTFCDVAVTRLAADAGVDFTYERPGVVRDHLWRGHYQDPSVMRHLGGDYNVPSATRVGAPLDCINLFTYTDVSYGGWGGVVLLCTDIDLPLILLAHLDPALLPVPGARFLRGETVGFVSSAETNGNWYPHLHVQGIDVGLFAQHGERLFSNIDGYGRNDQPVPEEFPDLHDVVFADA